jgi:hypothetical protein
MAPARPTPATVRRARSIVAAQALRLGGKRKRRSAERGRTLEKLGQAFLAPEAHTVAVDSSTHLVYSAQDGLTLRIMKPAG